MQACSLVATITPLHIFIFPCPHTPTPPPLSHENMMALIVRHLVSHGRHPPSCVPQLLLCFHWCCVSLVSALFAFGQSRNYGVLASCVAINCTERHNKAGISLSVSCLHRLLRKISCNCKTWVLVCQHRLVGYGVKISLLMRPFFCLTKIISFIKS